MVRRRFLSFGIALSMSVSLLFTSAVPGFAHETDAVQTQLISRGHLIYNNNFSDGVGYPWTIVESLPGQAVFSISDNAYSVKVVNPGADKYDVQLRHRGISIKKDHTYTIKFTVLADKASKVYARVGSQKEMQIPTTGEIGFAEAWNYKQSWAPLSLPANIPVPVSETFKAAYDIPLAEISFFLGNGCGDAGTTFKFSSISLDDPEFEGYKVPIDQYRIHTNQLGYYPSIEKIATYVSDSSTPKTWILKNNRGNEVASGKTLVKGFDPDSGDNVHIIDFSNFINIGKDYKLYVESDASYAFDIDNDLYKQGEYDAFKYFYYARSGTNIEMPYCENMKWTHPAGNLKDIATGSGFTRDLTGGWYDAGSNAKYVVNGGISLWTMLNQYERSKYIPGAVQYKDSTLNIPESGNRVPDILDEAKWEMDWIMKMQVPSGSKAGMAFHSVCDGKTMLSLTGDYVKERNINPPSTAATLSLAATAAQTARIWKDIDPTYSAMCLDIAARAWKAALANPDISAPMSGAYPAISSGGKLSVEDDFYWAACELYATTNGDEYLNYIKGSKFYCKVPAELSGGEDMDLDGLPDYGDTSVLGTLTLALVKGNKDAQYSIKHAADTFMNIQAKQGYGTNILPKETVDPIDPSSMPIVGYPGSSNSIILSRAILMAYASDFSKMNCDSSGSKKYLNGAAQALDYILGRNPMGQCYVTGWGSKPLQNPTHNLFAYQSDPSYPKAPPGFLSGGPNSRPYDMITKSLGWKPGQLPPQKCFIDNIDAFSVNSVSTTSNASLAWMAAYMDDVGPSEVPPDLKGDINGDFVVNIIDAVMLKSFILKKSSPIIKSLNDIDMNDDGNINSIDYLLLKNLIRISI